MQEYLLVYVVVREGLLKPRREGRGLSWWVVLVRGGLLVGGVSQGGLLVGGVSLPLKTY